MSLTLSQLQTYLLSSSQVSLYMNQHHAMAIQEAVEENPGKG